MTIANVALAKSAHLQLWSAEKRVGTSIGDRAYAAAEALYEMAQKSMPAADFDAGYEAAIEREAVESTQPRRAPLFDAFLARCATDCIEGGE